MVGSLYIKNEDVDTKKRGKSCGIEMTKGKRNEGYVYEKSSIQK